MYDHICKAGIVYGQLKFVLWDDEAVLLSQHSIICHDDLLQEISRHLYSVLM